MRRIRNECWVAFLAEDSRHPTPMTKGCVKDQLVKFSESNKPRILETSDLGYFGKNHKKSSKVMNFDDKIIKNHDF